MVKSRRKRLPAASHLGELVAQLRAQLQVSQPVLASRAGVSQQTLSRLETHPEGAIEWDTVRRLARALGVNVADFDAALPEPEGPDLSVPLNPRKWGVVSADVAKRIRRRVEAGEPRAAVAADEGVSETYISRLMTGKRGPRDDS